MNCVASFWKIGKEPRQQRRGVERGELTRIVTSCALWFVDFWDFQKLGRRSSKAGCHGQRSPSTAGGNLERPPVFWQSPALLRPWGEWETSTGGVNRVPPLHPKLFRWDILPGIHWSSYFIFLVRIQIYSTEVKSKYLDLEFWKTPQIQLYISLSPVKP